ncbi:MAG: NADH-quinone oxidoreductase subunit N [Acidimicrobiia bacterium]
MLFEVDYLALAPELIIVATLVVVLTTDLFVRRENKYWIAAFSVLAVPLAAIPLIIMAVDGSTRSMFGDSFVVDTFALFLKGFFLVAAYLVLLMSVSYIEGDRYYQGEYYFLILCSLLGSMIMSSSRDLIVMFIGLELTTAPLFMLAGWRKGDMRSNEASLKYYILGVLSTALLLYGMSLVYGLTGAVSFSEISAAVADPELAGQPAMGVAVLLMIVGFGFKISSVPFHFWAPDVYEGAPTPVTAYLSVNSKAAGFVAMLIVLYLAVPGVASVWAPAVWAMAAGSMIVGNLSALRQQNIVRLLAYSSIAQAGFMLVPFAAAAVAGADLSEAFSATVIYLVIFGIMNLGAFAVVIAAARKTGSGDIDGWAGLGSYDPRLGLLAGAFFFSLAGIPPLAGWFAKFVMFRSVMIAGGGATVALAVIAAVNTVIALYYYARVVKAVWLDEAPAIATGDRNFVPSGSLRLALLISGVLTLVVGVFPAIASIFGDASRVLATGG